MKTIKATTKRILYKIISILIGISNFLIPFLAEKNSVTDIAPVFIHVVVFVFSSAIIALLFAGIGKFLRCFWWIDALTTKQKKVYHSDLGYFYIEYNIKKEKTTLYEQKIFTQVKISEIDSVDPEFISKKIKSILDDKYRTKLKAEQKRKKIETWDGFLDKVGKRDQKIDQIIK